MISTTQRLISTSLAFEPIVLVSRPISWTTNSSLRPELSGSSITSTYWARWARSRTISSAMSARSAKMATSRIRSLGSIGDPLVLDQRLDPLGQPLLVRGDDLGPAVGDPARGGSAIAWPERQQLGGHGAALLGPGGLEPARAPR